MDIVKNVANHLQPPCQSELVSVHCVRGDYLYYHYGCDGFMDQGWGCGYRTLQTLCSWVMNQKNLQQNTANGLPSIKQIQECLVSMGDKPQSFVNSRDWIGSVEVGLVLDQLFDVPCKIVHIPKGELCKNIDVLTNHFESLASPVMMGGDSDAASKAILGVCRTQDQDFLLVLDPHYTGATPTQEILIDKQMLLWKPVDAFMADSFYNLCLPQLKSQVSKGTT